MKLQGRVRNVSMAEVALQPTLEKGCWRGRQGCEAKKAVRIGMFFPNKQ